MGLEEKLQEKIPRFRFHALAAAAFVTLILFLLRLGPRFLTVVSFFWPLLLSTAFFLAAVLVLRVISPPPAEVLTNQTGEAFMDYVASHSPIEVHQQEAGQESGENDSGAPAAAVGSGEPGADAVEKTKKSQ